MIRSRKSLIGLIPGLVLFSVFSLSAQAQENRARPNTEEIAALREKAFKLLDTIAGQLTTLQSAENRARMGANIFDSLWKHDQERARSLLRVVQEDIKTELQKTGDDRSDHARFEVFLRLRKDTIERISKYDGLAALDFLKATYPVFAKDEPFYFREHEQALELRLAKQIAANNPDAALKLGRQALEQGLNNELLALLTRLNRKHKSQGQVLYREIVEKLRDADFLSEWPVRNFAQTLVQSFEPPDADASAYRELVGVIAKAASAQGCEKKFSDDNMRMNFCQWAASTIFGAERYDLRVARMKHWLPDGYDLHGYASLSREVQELLQEGAFDEVEALALKYPERQVSIYQQVIFQVVSTGEMDRARKLVDRFPGEPRHRQTLLAIVEGYEKRNNVSDEQLAEIQKRAEEIPNGRPRVQYLMSVANQLGATDRELGMKFLERAREAIDTLTPGKEQMRAHVSLALMYSVLKSDRGFTIMESLVPKLNELVEVAVKLDGYDTNYLRDGEWNMSAGGSIGEILTILSQRAGDFAWCDFDRAVSLASQFERPEIRMMAQLKLAQSILEGPGRQNTRRWVSFGY